METQAQQQAAREAERDVLRRAMDIAIQRGQARAFYSLREAGLSARHALEMLGFDLSAAAARMARLETEG